MLTATALAVVSTIALAAYVLSSQVPGLGDATEWAAKEAHSPPKKSLVQKVLRRPPSLPFGAALGRQGVLRLYGYAGPEEFFLDMANDPTEKEALQAAAIVVSDYAAHRQTQKRFRTFMVVWVVMLVVVLAAGSWGEVIRSDATTAPVTRPIAVVLIPTHTGWNALMSSGCHLSFGEVTAWAIGEPAWDPRRLYTLEARMEPWTGNRRHRRGTRLS